MRNYQLTSQWYHTNDSTRLVSIQNQNRLSLGTRYGVYVVTTGTHIILIFIVESPKDRGIGLV